MPTLNDSMTVADFMVGLGGIDPRRVLMRPRAGTATEADLIAVHDTRERLVELLDGTLVEKVCTIRASVVAVAMGSHLLSFAHEASLGAVSGPNGPFRLAPGLVRMPDVAFTSWDRMPGRRLSREPIAGFAPNLAIEINDDGNTPGEANRKLHDYFAAGTQAMWMIDVPERSVMVHKSPADAVVLSADDEICGGALLPGFRLRVGDVFAELERTAPG
jgi:Uma2 family endonuclease